MDPPDYNRKFAEEHSFGYPLISNGEAVIRQFGACRREDRCTGKRTTAVIRADGTLMDFIDPFDAVGAADLNGRQTSWETARHPPTRTHQDVTNALSEALQYITFFTFFLALAIDLELYDSNATGWSVLGVVSVVRVMV